MPGAPPTQRSSVSSPQATGEVDLTAEEQRTLRELDARLPGLTHWDVLGISWNAPVDAARAAYLDRARELHPDRHAGRRLGPFLPILERLFRAATAAREVLCDEGRRATYARETAPPDELSRAESVRRSEAARSAERRARLARATPLVARATRVQELLRRGKEAMAEGRFGQASADLLTAAGLDPHHAEAGALASEAKRRAGGERARDRHQEGLRAEAAGQGAAALELYREALAADPANPRHAIAAARAALGLGQHAEATELARAAVAQAPGFARAHEALGEALTAEGRTKEALRALERALELDPALKGVRALARKLRWSFLG